MTDSASPDARAPWVLALDAGSSSVRAALYDARGRPLRPEPLARVPGAWRTVPDGAMETDADALFAACVAALDAGVDAAREAGIRVEAVAMAAFWHGLAGAAEDGTALTPLYGWGDSRARGAAQALRERVDARAVHRRTGCFVHESYPAARLVWLRGARDDTFPRVSAWVSVGELLLGRLFGRWRTSPSMASGTGLLDLRALAWDAQMLEAVGVSPARLPEVSDEPLRGLRPEWARRWPELADTPFFPALGDGACASLGSGAVGADRLALTVGTSAAARVLGDAAEPEVPDGLWCYRLDARRAVWGRALSNAGSAFAWLRRTLALPPREETEAALLAMTPRSHGLTVVPSLLGERPPLEEDAGAAMMRGMTPSTTPLEIARAWMEAVAERIARMVAAVEEAHGRAERVIASGGALNDSRAFTRMVEDALGRPLHFAADAEATARGAALLALERIGAIEDALAFAREGAGAEKPGGSPASGSRG
ncbi:MAG TPA: gluconokinase [Longimicrobium sp.]|nr:gluconokinase [Longimicrobium sp.]